MRADRRDPKIAEIKRFKGTKFVANLLDGGKRELALSTRANRWELFLETIEALAWVSIEVMDNDGKVLGIVESDKEYVDDDDDLEMARLERFAKIIAGAYANSMQEARRIGDTFERAVASLQSVFGTMADAYGLSLKVAQAQAAMGGKAEPIENEGEVMKMLMMALQLMRGGQPAITVGPPPQAKRANAPNGKPT